MKQYKTSYSMMIFPSGPICNMECDYCYYKEKKLLYTKEKKFMMTEELLEKFTKQYIESQSGNIVIFVWQGGEPLLRGLDFFKKAIMYQKKYLPENYSSMNLIQTNGTLITAEWCKFFKENNFLVGVSIDGPEKIHNYYRKYKGAETTFRDVIRGLKLLQKYRIEYNVICTVNNINVKYPLDVYNFFKKEGIKFIQFIPIVNHLGNGDVSSHSIDGKDYGEFLVAIFNEWINKDFGDIYVQMFEECIRGWFKIKPSTCLFSETCGKIPVMEYNGDIYVCDHFVENETKMGNIMETPLNQIIQSNLLKDFGQRKSNELPKICQECEYKFICNGGCLRCRIVNTNNDYKINYLCDGYRYFFKHVDPFMKLIVKGLIERTNHEIVKNQLINLYKLKP